MKKLTLAAVMFGMAAFVGSCSHKMHANLMDPKVARAAAAPTATPAQQDVTYVPFTKMKKQQLESNNIDLRQVQFYIDQKVILRRMDGSDREIVKNGTIVKESNRKAHELVIPEMTPVLCDRVVGDTLMISFEAGNELPFGMPYGSNTFSILGSNWINGSADVTYDNQTYRIICGSCGNIAEVRLMVKESNVDKSNNANKTIVGRKLGK